MTKLEQLQTVVYEATQGEWKALGFHSQAGEVACLIGPDTLRLVSGNFKTSDAKYIALAHNLMPALLEATRQRKVLSDAINALPMSVRIEHELYSLITEIEGVDV